MIFNLKNINDIIKKEENIEGDYMLGNDWDLLLKDEMEKEYFQKLFDFVREQYQEKDIYPKMNEIFNAFRHTAYKDVKVVILGQDPYHGENEAEGLSFSVKPGIRKPPSLNNIFVELKNDLGYEYPKYGSLVKWADEGVLLLNSVLTVEKDNLKLESCLISSASP